MVSVCAYCRVSTDSKDQANSYENQNLYFNRELTKNPDYKLYKIYADKGVSGTKLHREQFDLMLNDAGLDILEVKNDSGYLKYVTLPSNRQPKFKYIFVKNTSRFARNIEVSSIFRDLSRMGVYVVFLDLGKSTENESDATYIQIFCSFDERESRDQRTKVLFGIEEGNKKGVIRTNGKLFGYRYIQSENRLEVIESEAVIIRRIFSLYADGYGIRQIINILDAEGHKTRSGKRFVKNAIRRILDNEKYYGVSNKCKNYIGNDLFDKFSTPKRKEDGDYELRESYKIPPIIDKETFYKCKDILHSKVNYEAQRGVKKPVSKYAGLVYCETCGSVYVSNVDRGRRYYNCKTKKLRGSIYCDNPNISYNRIEKLITDFISTDKTDNLIEQELLYWYALGRFLIDSEPINTEDIDLLKDKEKTLLERLDGLYDLYALKSDTKGNLTYITDKIDKVEQELEAVREQLLALTSSDSLTVNKIKYIQSKIDDIEDIRHSIKTVEQLLPYIIIYVNRQGEAHITYRSFDNKDKFIDMSLDDSAKVIANMTEPDINKNTFNNYLITHNI